MCLFTRKLAEMIATRKLTALAALCMATRWQADKLVAELREAAGGKPGLAAFRKIIS